MKWLLGFLSSKDGDGSSKRLILVLSYVVSFGVIIYSVAANKHLDQYQVIVMLGLCGVSTSNYSFTNKNELKAPETDKTGGAE